MRKLLSLAIAVCMSPSTFSLDCNAESCSAKSAIVIDYATGEVLYEKNAYDKMPMASTTKIMSALLSIESGNLDERFTVDSEAIKVEGSSMGMNSTHFVTPSGLDDNTD